MKAQSPTVNVFAAPDKGLDPEFIQFGSGVFKACDAKAPPSPFTSGSSYDTCLTYLMPEGHHFAQAPLERRHPVRFHPHRVVRKLRVPVRL